MSSLLGGEKPLTVATIPVLWCIRERDAPHVASGKDEAGFRPGTTASAQTAVPAPLSRKDRTGPWARLLNTLLNFALYKTILRGWKNGHNTIIKYMNLSGDHGAWGASWRKPH